MSLTFCEKRKRAFKVFDTPSQENVVLRSLRTKKHMVSRACASEDRVDLVQYDNYVQMTMISTIEVLPRISAQVMLKNISVLKIVTGEFAGVLSKINEFVKQISILLIFIFSYYQLEDF